MAPDEAGDELSGCPKRLVLLCNVELVGSSPAVVDRPLKIFEVLPRKKRKMLIVTIKKMTHHVC